MKIQLSHPFVSVAGTMVLVMLLGVPIATAQVAPNESNPLQVAILRWYNANQSGLNFSTLGSVGGALFGAAFDGSNIWVSNSETNTVTKLRASDGAVLGNFSLRCADIGECASGQLAFPGDGNRHNVLAFDLCPTSALSRRDPSARCGGNRLSAGSTVRSRPV